METTAGTLQKRGLAAAKKAKKAAIKFRSETMPMLKRVSGHAWQGVEQGIEAIDDTAQRARDVSKKASKSIVAYTRKKPVKALAIAAASGVLLHAAVKAFKPARSKQPATRRARA